MSVSDATREREKDKLFVTDAELIRRLGIPKDLGYSLLRQFDAKPCGFPRKQKLWGDRRWWPDVVRFIERNSGTLGDDAARFATENRDRTRPPRPSSLRHPAEGSHDH